MASMSNNLVLFAGRLMKDGERGVEGDELDDCSSSGLLCLGVWNSLLGLFGDTGALMVVPTTLSTLPAEALVLAVCIEGDGEASLDAIVDFDLLHQMERSFSIEWILYVGST